MLDSLVASSIEVPSKPKLGQNSLVTVVDDYLMRQANKQMMDLSR